MPSTNTRHIFPACAINGTENCLTAFYCVCECVCECVSLVCEYVHAFLNQFFFRFYCYISLLLRGKWQTNLVICIYRKLFDTDFMIQCLCYRSILSTGTSFPVYLLSILFRRSSNMSDKKSTRLIWWTHSIETVVDNNKMRI